MAIILSRPRHRKDSRVLVFLRPEDRLNAEFNMRCVNDAQIVRQYFAVHFISRRHLRATANRIAEFRLNHAARTLDVRPLVIVVHVLLAVELVVVEHLLEQAARAARRVRLDRDEWRRASREDRLDILDREVSLARGANLT